MSFKLGSHHYSGLSRWEQANQDAMELQDEQKAKKKAAVQAKSETVSDPADAQEKQADEIAAKVSSGENVALNNIPVAPASAVQTKQEGDGGMQTTPEFSESLNSSKGSGQALPENVQSELGTQMGADFSGVKVHTDAQANTLSKDINAKAFTHGSDIYFRQGQFNPQSGEGKNLLAHELVHTRQQSMDMVQPMIQRYGDGSSNIANEGVAGTRGSLDYLPEKVDLVASLNSTSPTPETRKTFITDFVGTFYDYYLSLLAAGRWDKIKTVATNAADNTFTAAQRTAPMYDRGQYRMSHWNDFGKRMSLGTTETNAVNLVEARVLSDADKIKYPALANLTTTNQTTYGSILDTAAASADTTADLVIQLRAVSNIVSRFYVAQKVSETTGMAFERTLALQGQEGNFDMPSSAASLSKNIPTGESQGVTSAHSNGNFLDFKGMVFTIPTDSDFMTSRKTPGERKLFALAQYFNQIGGLDVVNQNLDKGIPGLAAWSLSIRTSLEGHNALPTTYAQDTLASLTTLWQNLVANINEEVVSFKTSIPDPDPTTPKDTVYRFAPIDPIYMATSILSEAALLQKSYDYFPGEMMGSGASALTLSPGVAYMVFNSTSNTDYTKAKTFFSSGLRSAKIRSQQKINTVTTANSAKKAEDVSIVDLQANDPNVDQKFLYLYLELVTFPSNAISDKPTETEFDTNIKPWILAASRLAPYTRWELSQYYLEHAGTDIWTSWAQTRRNSSNLRTLMEFYQNIFH